MSGEGVERARGRDMAPGIRELEEGLPVGLSVLLQMLPPATSGDGEALFLPLWILPK